MPSVAQPVQQILGFPVGVNEVQAKSRLEKPLKLSGTLDVEYNDMTPAIGREFPQIQLVDLLSAPDSDDMIRDFAVTGKYSSECRSTPLRSFGCILPLLGHILMLISLSTRCRVPPKPKCDTGPDAAIYG